MIADWYNNFFHGITIDMWRQAVQPELTAAEVDFILQQLELPPNAHVLDIPCGHGRHAIELARRGYRVTGVDLSTDALAYAMADAEAAGVSIEWRQMSMQDLDDSAAFDGAVHLGNSFGYMPHALTCRFLDRVGRALRPGARLVIDYGAVAEGVLPSLKEKFVKFGGTLGDIQVDIENEYAAAESRLDTTFRFTRNGRTETRQSHQHVYTIAELTRMLAAAGMTVLQFFGSSQTTDKYCFSAEKKYELGDQIWIVAQRIV
jgi:SAM-dependent methyltransferase